MGSDSAIISPKHYATLKRQLTKAHNAATNRQALYQAVVNAPFTDRLMTTSIDLGIVVLLLVDKKKQWIERVALSETELAKGAVKVSAKPFHDIKIPADYSSNIIAIAINTHTPYQTDDWRDLFVPALTASEARLNQAGASIETSMVCPLDIPQGGALIFSFYQPPNNIGDEHQDFAQRYAKLVSETLAG